MNDIEQVLITDETHKDNNASRRRKSWDKHNSGGIALTIQNSMRHTMIAVSNTDSFMRSSIELVSRYESSDECAEGTVDREHLEVWARDYLCLCLGQY